MQSRKRERWGYCGANCGVTFWTGKDREAHIHIFTASRQWRYIQQKDALSPIVSRDSFESLELHVILDVIEFEVMSDLQVELEVWHVTNACSVHRLVLCSRLHATGEIQALVPTIRLKRGIQPFWNLHKVSTMIFRVPSYVSLDPITDLDSES